MGVAANHLGVHPPGLGHQWGDRGTGEAEEDVGAVFPGGFGVQGRHRGPQEDDEGRVGGQEGTREGRSSARTDQNQGQGDQGQEGLAFGPDALRFLDDRRVHRGVPGGDERVHGDAVIASVSSRPMGTPLMSAVRARSPSCHSAQSFRARMAKAGFVLNEQRWKRS